MNSIFERKKALLDKLQQAEDDLVKERRKNIIENIQVGRTRKIVSLQVEEKEFFDSNEAEIEKIDQTLAEVMRECASESFTKDEISRFVSNTFGDLRDIYESGALELETRLRSRMHRFMQDNEEEMERLDEGFSRDRSCMNIMLSDLERETTLRKSKAVRIDGQELDAKKLECAAREKDESEILENRIKVLKGETDFHSAHVLSITKPCDDRVIEMTRKISMILNENSDRTKIISECKRRIKALQLKLENEKSAQETNANLRAEKGRFLKFNQSIKHQVVLRNQDHKSKMAQLASCVDRARMKLKKQLETVERIDRLLKNCSRLRSEFPCPTGSNDKCSTHSVKELDPLDFLDRENARASIYAISLDEELDTVERNIVIMRSAISQFRNAVSLTDSSMRIHDQSHKI